MSKFGSIRVIEQKVRSSMVYMRWVTRNKAPSCLGCGGKQDLECHHVVALYQIVVGWWKYYEDEQSTLYQVLAMHEDDHCPNITLCSDCHAKRHPLRTGRRYKGGPIRTDNWTAFPRLLDVPLSHSTKDKTSSSLGLVGFQILLSMGWYVLNGHMDSKIININRLNLAKMLNKSSGTSFNKSLDDTLRVLSKLGILNGHHRKGNDLELHLSPDYLNNLGGNPWFISIEDIKTSSMCVLTLRKYLATQSNRKTCKIGLDKLKPHLRIIDQDNWRVFQALKKACKEIKWVKVKMEQGMCVFSITRRGATPIHDLRSTLLDSISGGT